MTLPGRDHKTQLYQVGGMVSLLFQRGGILMVLRFRNAQFQFFSSAFRARYFDGTLTKFVHFKRHPIKEMGRFSIFDPCQRNFG